MTIYTTLEGEYISTIGPEILKTHNVTYLKLPPNMVVVPKSVAQAIKIFESSSGYAEMPLSEYLDSIFATKIVNVGDLEDLLVETIEIRKVLAKTINPNTKYLEAESPNENSQ